MYLASRNIAEIGGFTRLMPTMDAGDTGKSGIFKKKASLALKAGLLSI